MALAGSRQDTGSVLPESPWGILYVQEVRVSPVNLGMGLECSQAESLSVFPQRQLTR